jgi:hypothetical protein
MDLDKLEAETNANKTEDYPQLKQKELELMRQYNSFFESDSFKKCESEFRDHFIKEYKEFFINRNYNISEFTQNVIVASKLDMNIKLEIFRKSSFTLIINNSSKKRFQFEINLSKKVAGEPKHHGVLWENGIMYGGQRNTNTTEFVLNNIRLLEEDIKNLEIPFFNIKYTDFVCVFNSDLDIPGEFTTIQEMIEAIPE